MSKGQPYPAKRGKSTMVSLVKCATTRSKSDSVIHSLPEDIMHEIVSRLTLKDAIRTSSLLTNWRRLWTYHPNLCFDSPTILNRKSGGRSKSRRHRFIRRVNAVLESHCGIGLRTFKITFALAMRHSKHLDRWLCFALASRAPEIAINLLPVLYKGSARSWEEAYTIPFDMLSSQGAAHIESLQLVLVSFKPPCDFDGFKNLRVLDLRFVYLGDLVLLLSKCNALECLRLDRCFPLLNFKVQQPLCRLRYLSIRGCRQHGIELHAANLANFEYSGEAIPITFDESVKLTEASVTLWGYDDSLEHVFTEVPKTLSRVETLSVRACVNTEVVGFSRCMIKFTQLIKLELTVSIMGDSRCRDGILRLASILEVAPLLQRLELNMLPCTLTGIFGEPEARFSIPACTHRHLEQVEISGFFGLKGQVELAWYILDNAVALRCMTIDPRQTSSHNVFGNGEGFDFEIRMGRECALRLFSQEDYPDVQIEVF